jgi:hypothetical protein
MNERGWQNPNHAGFTEWARTQLAARVGYLRYNTGLRISERRAPRRVLGAKRAG